MFIVRCLRCVLAALAPWVLLVGTGWLFASLQSSGVLSAEPLRPYMELALAWAIPLGVLALAWMAFKRMAWLALCCLVLAPWAYDGLGLSARGGLSRLREGLCRAGAEVAEVGLRKPYAPVLSRLGCEGEPAAW